MVGSSTRGLAIILLTLALTLAVACGGSPARTASGAGANTNGAPAANATAEPLARTTLKVAYVPVLAFGPLYRGLAKGYFDAAGIDVELSVVQSASDAVAFLGNGQIDVALGNVGAPLFNAVNRGLEVRVVAGNSYNVTDPETLASAPFVVRRQLIESGAVRSPADLRGRKVAINALGGIQEYTLAISLGHAQLTPKDVDIQLLAFPDMISALQSGAVDAALLPEPFSAAARDQGVASVLVANPAPGATVTAVLFGSNLLKPEREREARAFLDAMRKAANELQTAQDIFSAENLAIWTQYTNVAEERIAKGAPYAYAANLVLDVKSLQDQQQFLLREGRLEFQEALADNKIVDLRFNPR